MKVLIVDDKVENIYLLEALLRGNGYETESAENGAEALNKLRSSSRFGLIISDILMPVMDGFQLCREVRADDKLRHIPFIVYTATYTGPQDEVFAKKIGADCFVVKPCEPEILMHNIQEVLDSAEILKPGTDEQPKEEEILKLYNERLVRKLEQKMMELEQELQGRREAEKALRESEEKHRMLFETMLQGVVYQDRDGRITDANPAAERILGLSLDRMKGVTSTDPCWRSINEDGSDFPGEDHPAMVALKTGKSVGNVIMGVNNRIDKGTRWIRINSIPVFHAGERTPYQVYSTFDDITERRQAEEEKARLEAQLLQAMKMEAVGRLAGGIAHDFNNLLTCIIGHVSMAFTSIHPEDPLAETLSEIGHAADSAANLTRQLLAFSRKQIIEPRVIDLNELIGNLEKMLTRLIGEDVILKTDYGKNLAAVKVDPGQFEQILVNLAVNARDAMPSGGKFVIETSNVEVDEKHCLAHPEARAGRYVMLAVSDTGHGMSEEVIKHIFEPFFTTKQEGHGTGLGLAITYGAVKQAGGYIDVVSEPGKGSCFKIYLPQAKEKAESSGRTKSHNELPGGGETILLVEDEAIVRNLVIKILKRLGYNVIHASDGKKAISLAKEHKDRIDLLMTDVIMPEINGRELAEHLKTIHPEMKILFTSGYTEDVIIQRGIVEENTNFIGKPYNFQQLAIKLREVLA